MVPLGDKERSKAFSRQRNRSRAGWQAAQERLRTGRPHRQVARGAAAPTPAPKEPPRARRASPLSPKPETRSRAAHGCVARATTGPRHGVSHEPDSVSGSGRALLTPDLIDGFGVKSVARG